MELNLLPQTLPQHAFAEVNGPVFARPGPGMVGVGMGDQGPRHRSPWIDPGIGGAAVQTLGGVFNHGRTVSIRSDGPGSVHSEDDTDFREPWARVGERKPAPSPQHFQFREAGVERFNDVYDDGYDED